MMSMMDKLKQMLKGHGERIGQGHDTAGRAADDARSGRPAGQADKGPDALRDQFQPPRDRDNPPQS
ncbi:antitoxin [Streptomyces sp. NPDC004393]|uniref:antitoxin n=1 Tax=Streptomyces sp. NPDC004533 TaxID=3154278 RepID=UPI0033AC05E9